MSKPKLLVFDQLSYAEPFTRVFDILYANTQEKLLQGVDDCDVVLFTGGSDVSPHLYNEPEGRYTSPNPNRDKFEVMVWNLAQQKEKGILGICRGLQFACVMAGGKLVQDTTGHAGAYHMIEDIFGNSLMFNSVHHQMVRPETIPSSSVVIAWTKGKHSKHYTDGFGKEIYNDKEETKAWLEPEIVWIPKFRALGIQGHPEMSENVELHEYCCKLVEYYLLDKKQQTPSYRITV